MARNQGKDWRLDDAERLHQENPRSFFIPSADRRRGLRHDDVVRLVFLVTAEPREASGERMWLTDIERHGDRYVGVVTNEPVYIEDLSLGDEIEFGPEHVVAVVEPDGIPTDVRAFASRRLIEDDSLIPRFVYHDASELEWEPGEDGQRASGWSLLVGDETEEEVSDPSQVLTPSLGWLTERYPAFGALVRSGVSDRTFEWDDAADAYIDTGPYVEEE